MIRTSPDDPLPERLLASTTSSRRWSRQLRPSALAVERVLFQNNVRTAMSVGQASGLALVAAARAGIPVAQYSPNEVKLAVTGDGRADKLAVQTMVTRLLALARDPEAGRRGRRARARVLPSSAGAPAIAAQVGIAVVIGSVRGTVDRAHARAARCSSRSAASATACSVPVGAVPALEPGSNAFLFTHLHVRDDAMVLFGFPTRDERDTFEALITATRCRAEARARDPVGALAARACGAASPRTTSTRSCSCPASASAPRSGCSST